MLPKINLEELPSILQQNASLLSEHGISCYSTASLKSYAMYTTSNGKPMTKEQFDILKETDKNIHEQTGSLFNLLWSWHDCSAPLSAIYPHLSSSQTKSLLKKDKKLFKQGIKIDYKNSIYNVSKNKIVEFFYEPIHAKEYTYEQALSTLDSIRKFYRLNIGERMNIARAYAKGIDKTLKKANPTNVYFRDLPYRQEGKCYNDTDIALNFKYLSSNIFLSILHGKLPNSPRKTIATTMPHEIRHGWQKEQKKFKNKNEESLSIAKYFDSKKYPKITYLLGVSLPNYKYHPKEKDAEKFTYKYLKNNLPSLRFGSLKRCIKYKLQEESAKLLKKAKKSLQAVLVDIKSSRITTKPQVIPASISNIV